MSVTDRPLWVCQVSHSPDLHEGSLRRSLHSEHRRADAAARLPRARAARRRPAPIDTDAPPLADDDAAVMFTTLGRHHVASVVIGGVAAVMWGAGLPRTTDADIMPAADADNRTNGSPPPSVSSAPA